MGPEPGWQDSESGERQTRARTRGAAGRGVRHRPAGAVGGPTVQKVLLHVGFKAEHGDVCHVAAPEVTVLPPSWDCRVPPGVSGDIAAAAGPPASVVNGHPVQGRFHEPGRRCPPT